MSTSRSSLIQILKNADAETIKKCRKSKNKLEEIEHRNRIFDDFPDLLFPQEINDLQMKLEAIVITIKTVLPTKDGFRLHDSDAEQIADWTKRIVNIACAELLDQEGKIKTDITQCLEWKKDLPQEHVCEVICAYVGHLSLTILTSLLQKKIASDPEKTIKPEDTLIPATINHFVSSNYGSWCAETIRRAGFLPGTPPIEVKHSAGHKKKSKNGNKSKQVSHTDKAKNHPFFADSLEKPDIQQELGLPNKSPTFGKC